MSSLVSSKITFSEQLQELSYEEKVIYAGVIYGLLVENFKDLDYLNQMSLDHIKDIDEGLEEIIDIFIELELIDYLEDILEIRESIKKLLKNNRY
jgi:hypothetical protein